MNFNVIHKKCGCSLRENENLFPTFLNCNLAFNRACNCFSICRNVSYDFFLFSVTFKYARIIFLLYQDYARTSEFRMLKYKKQTQRVISPLTFYSVFIQLSSSCGASYGSNWEQFGYVSHLIWPRFKLFQWFHFKLLASKRSGSCEDLQI